MFNHLKSKFMEFLQAGEDSSPTRLPFFKTVFGPYTLFMDNFKNFILVAALFALALSFIALASGLGYMCLYPEARNLGGCRIPGLPLYLSLFVLKIFVAAMFAVKWYNVSFNKFPIRWCYLFSVDRSVLKTFLAFVVLFLILAVPLLSTYILYVRIPNPDWRIELIFFAFVSLGYIFPFVVMKFNSIFAFLMGNEPVPPLSCIWRKNNGNLLRILLGLFLLLLISFFSFVSYYSNFRSVAPANTIYISIIVEYLYNIILLAITTFFIGHCYLQKTLLFGENQNEQ